MTIYTRIDIDIYRDKNWLMLVTLRKVFRKPSVSKAFKAATEWAERLPVYTDAVSETGVYHGYTGTITVSELTRQEFEKLPEYFRGPYISQQRMR